MSLADVNFLAVGIATVLAFALGALWYSPVLFAKPRLIFFNSRIQSLRKCCTVVFSLDLAGSAPNWL